MAGLRNLRSFGAFDPSSIDRLSRRRHILKIIFQVSFNYYLPQNAALWLDSEGDFKTIVGAAAENPENPKPLSYAGVRLLTICQLLGGGSHFIQSVVIGWFTYNLTGSRILTSMSWGVDSLSNVISGPIGGLAADRWERKTILAYTQFIKAIIILAFSIV